MQWVEAGSSERNPLLELETPVERSLARRTDRAPSPLELPSFLKYQFDHWLDSAFNDDLRARLAAISSHCNEFGYDPFGFNPESGRLPMLLAYWLYKNYFRVQSIGTHRVPSGRALLVANHSGQLPYDGLCILSALLFDHQPPRMVRAMIEKWIPRLPFVSYLFPRWGQILGDPDNCRRVLEQDEAILVFPEGARGLNKPFTQRYQLEPFGLGFMRLALETRTPIVPVAVVGAEEQAPAINIRPLARLLGWPAFPVMPFPPFLPIVPLPTKYRIYFGEPLSFGGDPDDDDDVIRKNVRVVENGIFSLMQLGLKERKRVFW